MGEQSNESPGARGKSVRLFRLTCPTGKNPMWACQKTDFEKKADCFAVCIQVFSILCTDCMDCLNMKKFRASLQEPG